MVEPDPELRLRFYGFTVTVYGYGYGYGYGTVATKSNIMKFIKKPIFYGFSQKTVN